MTVWLTPTKENDYASLKGGYNKETKASDPWNVAVTYDTFTWLETDGHVVIVGIASSVTGAMVAKANEANIKFPMPVKLAIKATGGTVGEQCIVKLLKGATESGKFYTGFISMNDANPFANAIATGKKGDGTELSEMEVKGFAGQFLMAADALQDKLTDDLIAKMGKVETWGKGGGYGAKSETLAEKIATRETKLKEYLGVNPEATFPQVIEEYVIFVQVKPSFADLITVLLS